MLSYADHTAAALDAITFNRRNCPKFLELKAEEAEKLRLANQERIEMEHIIVSQLTKGIEAACTKELEKYRTSLIVSCDELPPNKFRICLANDSLSRMYLVDRAVIIMGFCHCQLEQSWNRTNREYVLDILTIGFSTEPKDEKREQREQRECIFKNCRNCYPPVLDAPLG
jgi:hypothetical protein